ncbi:MAG: LysR family transcriptional regulator [Tractidigestivibacter sp.]|jgi:molybdate transport repressor ModE-like protein|uniref:LysR family transcriptional regulator n=1 Tax=Tractidigestivibacter sp. TaxID=2847320 RepID=UPI003D92080E
MNQRQLSYFITTMRCGSMKDAAHELGISPQGLSKTIIALEEEVGHPLFERTRHGLEPTAYAERLRPHAVAVLRAYDSLDRNFSRAASGKEMLDVVATYGFICTLPPSFFRQFSEMNPNVQLNLVEMTDYPAVERLRRGDSEIGVLPSPLDTAIFHGEPLFTARHCCIINQSNPLSQKEEIEYSDLAGQPLALKGRTYIMYNGNINRFLSHGTEPTIYMETSSDELIADLAEDNQAIGISLDYMAERTARPHTVARRFADPECCRTLYFAYPLGMRLSPPAEAFRRQLLELFKDGLPDSSSTK